MKDKIEQQSICIFKSQKSWLKNNPHFKLSEFVRAKLGEYIQIKKEVTEAWESEL